MLKRFLLNTLSSFVGTWIAVGLFILASVLFVIAMMANLSLKQDNTEKIKSRSVLVISLDGPIEEREIAMEPDIYTLMNGKMEKPQTLDVIVQAIREGAKNDDITLIYLKCGNVVAAPATLNVIRQQLIEFKKSGKKVYAYGDGLSQGSYFVASVADKLFMNPAGQVALQGLGSTNFYFKNLFDKLGVEFQVAKVGTYKSAVEPYILENMSEPARAQLDTLFSQMWIYVREGICESRKNLTPAKIDSLVSRDYIAFASSDDAVKSGLIDSLIYERNINQMFANLTGRDEKDVNFVSPATLVAQTPWAIEYSASNRIAVLYACGEIADGNDNAINYEQLVPQIVELADDEKVKGMVLRVNSPGGSVFGSTQIGEALDYFQSKRKPLAVSMGDYAASGGYWISAKADRIFADPLTITGSIGIFGLLPNVKGSLDDLGVNVESVATNSEADFPSLFKPMNETQMGVVQKYVERGYADFTNRVAQGRHMELKDVLAIAEGRVWGAQTAIKIGLVDQLASLDAAIDWVASKANVKDNFNVAAYPKVEPNFWSMIQLGGMNATEIVAALNANNMDCIQIGIARKILNRKPIQAIMPEFRVYL